MLEIYNWRSGSLFKEVRRFIFNICISSSRIPWFQLSSGVVFVLFVCTSLRAL